MNKELSGCINVTVNLIKTFDGYKSDKVNSIMEKHNYEPTFELLEELEQYEKLLKKTFYESFVHDMAFKYSYPANWQEPK
jgi:hypothetical protein